MILTCFWGKSFFRVIRFLVFVLICMIGSGFSASSASAAGILKIGLMDEPKTLNIWLASDKWSGRVLSLMYQRLYIRDPDTLELVPWLAEKKPVYDESTISYTVELRPAKWSDGSEFTSEDVAFTGRLIKEFKVPRYRARWKFIKKIETPDKRTVIFYLEKPMAVFTTRTLTSPIVQKKEWAPVVEKARNSEKPLTTLQNYKIKKPVGTGPFVLKQWRQGAFLFVQKNKHFFGTGHNIDGRMLGPNISGIIFKFFGTSDAAILALKKGTMDMFWWGIQAGYLEDLKKVPGIRLFSNERSALYYWGFNLRKLPFSDVNLRRAIAVLIDKDFIITRIVQGHATRMNSVIPPGNKFWLCSDLPRYGEGISREERIKKAYEILKKTGYTWKVPPVNEAGKLVKGQEIRLPNGEPMKKFSILTPPADYDPLRAMSGIIIQEWLKEIGIPVSAKPMAMGALLQKVKSQHDFDAFILGYGRLDIDPDWMRKFFHSGQDKKRGGNKAGYHNLDFDRIADESAATMDKEKRRKLIKEMQRIILRDVPYIPLYTPDLIEAVREDKFTGWVETLEGIGNLWSFCELKAK
ncbi:MAG: ABC transporter substrate-binding protein [Thermodesulfobacteriota bacterium]|nr:ABC transporter substrate-binding protein [Thermodesulfobacteriota bacterium]